MSIRVYSCCLFQGSFELYGADFMLTEDMRPWLLEVNSSPSMAQTTHATASLVERVLEDTLKGKVLYYTLASLVERVLEGTLKVKVLYYTLAHW